MANAIVIRRGRRRGRESGHDRSVPPPRRPARAPAPRRPARRCPAQQAAERAGRSRRGRAAAGGGDDAARAGAAGGDASSSRRRRGRSCSRARDGTPEAEIAYVAYTLPGADPATRPVTFAVNGGPGAASAYLNIGAIGPWRLPMDPSGPVPSQDVTLVPNAETWLPFTDLVFVDPVGTGFSRLIEPDDALRGRYLAIEGDVEALAQFVRRWLVENGRVRVAALLRRRELRRLPRAAGRRGAARGRGAGARRAGAGLAGARLRLVEPGRAYAVAGGGAAAVAGRRRDGGRGAILGGGARGGGGLRGGRLRDRPAARRAATRRRSGGSSSG